MSERYIPSEKQVLVVRVPDAAEQAKEVRDYIIESLQLGVLVLAPGVSYKLEELPDLGGVSVFGADRGYSGSRLPEVFIQEYASGASSDGEEKRLILARLQSYRKEYGAGCLTEVARKCGKGITEETLRDMLIGSVVLSIGDWRKVSRGLDKLGWEVNTGEAPAHG